MGSRSHALAREATTLCRLRTWDRLPACRSPADRLEAYPTYFSLDPYLVANRWRIVNEKIARSSYGVIGISYLGCGWSAIYSAVAILRVTEESLVVSTTTLPANSARAATERSVAVIAVIVQVVVASGASQHRDHNAQYHHCTLHLRLPFAQATGNKMPAVGHTITEAIAGRFPHRLCNRSIASHRFGKTRKFVARGILPAVKRIPNSLF